jgi:hypothetical protein
VSVSWTVGCAFFCAHCLNNIPAGYVSVYTDDSVFVSHHHERKNIGVKGYPFFLETDGARAFSSLECAILPLSFLDRWRGLDESHAIGSIRLTRDVYRMAREIKPLNKKVCRSALQYNGSTTSYN